MLLQCVIVDDNEPFLKVARRMLERQGMAVVGVAANGAEALRQARELRPDVALVDISLGADSPAAGFLSKAELSADAIRRLLT
jgi:DNA-binding NarL/FixJ family response regulator